MNIGVFLELQNEIILATDLDRRLKTFVEFLLIGITLDFLGIA
jgi:hypothetical protein